MRTEKKTNVLRDRQHVTWRLFLTFHHRLVLFAFKSCVWRHSNNHSLWSLLCFLLLLQKRSKITYWFCNRINIRYSDKVLVKCTNFVSRGLRVELSGRLCVRENNFKTPYLNDMWVDDIKTLQDSTTPWYEKSDNLFLTCMLRSRVTLNYRKH